MYKALYLLNWNAPCAFRLNSMKLMAPFSVKEIVNIITSPSILWVRCWSKSAFKGSALRRSQLRMRTLHSVCSLIGNPSGCLAFSANLARHSMSSIKRQKWFPSSSQTGQWKRGSGVRWERAGREIKMTACHRLSASTTRKAKATAEQRESSAGGSLIKLFSLYLPICGSLEVTCWQFAAAFYH